MFERQARATNSNGLRIPFVSVYMRVASSSDYRCGTTSDSSLETPSLSGPSELFP
jgi:hypothetical protein